MSPLCRLRLFAAICLFWAGQAVAAPASVMAPLSHYFKSVWTTREGLPHNTINSIAQTPDGYLWLTTWEGIARFNGKEFKVFGRDTGTGLPDAGIRAVYVDTKGRLIIGGARGGLATVTDGHWQAYKPLGYLINRVWADEAGAIWVGTEGGGLFRVDSQQHVSRWTTADGLPSNAIYSMVKADNGGIWIGTAKGLALWRAGHVSAVKGVPEVPVFDLRHYQGQLLIGSERGLYRLSGNRAEPVAPALLDLAITQLLADHQGSLWVGTVQRGIYRLSQRYGLEHLDMSFGLPSNRALGLFEDREHSIWVGTNGGLLRLRNSPFSAVTSDVGLSGNYVRTVLEDPSGDIWIGTARGLNRYSPSEARVVETVMQKQSILSLAFDTDGSLLVGTYASGLYRYWHGKASLFLDRDSGLSSNEVRALLPEADGSLWVGTSQGLNQVSQSGIKSFGSSDGLPGNFVVALTRFDNRLWIGTGTGLGTFDGKGFKTVPIRQHDKAEYAFGFYAEPANKRLWVATDRGLLRLDAGSGKSAFIGRQQGLPFDKYFQVFIDRQHNLWLTSNRGILRVSENDANAVADGIEPKLKPVLYGESDGMLSAQANGGSNPTVIEGRGGDIWIATAVGASHVQPSRLDEVGHYIPEVAIEGLWVDGQSHSLTGKLVLAPAVQRVQVKFAGLSFILPSALHYRSRLEGFDSGWHDNGTVDQLEFTNLAPGRYVLSIEAANRGGDWSLPARLVIVKQPYWWQSHWAPYLALVLALLLVALLVFWRTRHLRRSELRLLELVANKTDELKRQTESLRQANQEKSQLLGQLQVQALALEKQARQDVLTGLANRRAFDESLSAAFSQAHQQRQTLTLAFIDIDHFKAINDRFTHCVGDKALVRVAALLKSQCREQDLVARWGGEEFALLLPDTSLADGCRRCEQLRQAIADINGDDIAKGMALTVSIGVVCSEQASSSAALLQAADEALYLAKNTGRNQVVASAGPVKPA
ncbi:MAG: diguanylate cyclase [Pseudomonadota bacterium]|uniref:ligand-binding sensor domain-containing diguanylate cyclase n=1 Tax=Gallaecimonas pentaromativorans TaxID=584787 RepID=UPI00067E8D1D|nr:ligand-binding sensor domain-containing diguanylate cyclase [Gallaecimonas pentaromativorans]MED5524222.1 diguanylate cyclase [Pseudomonadota bacterium]